MTEKHKILIVDDSELNREILVDMLSDDFDIYQAEDGEEAIATLTTKGSMFSIVLLDITMPKADGFEVLMVMNKLKLIENVPVVMISSEVSDESIERSYRLGATDYITRPFNMVIVKKKVANVIMLNSKHKKLVDIVSEQVGEKEKNSEMLINILSHIVEFRNGESGLHVLHVRKITELLLEYVTQKTDKYALSMADKVMIANASALHDIGKIAIPDAILNKPDRFTDEEFAIMKTHSAAGAELVSQLDVYKDEPLVKSVYEICRWHHERYDGRGYPDGLKGDEIPISAQIVALADVYDALTSERCYKKAYSHEKAVDMILNNECGVFNPLLIECFVAAADLIKSELARGDDLYNDNTEAKLITQEILSRKDLSTPDSASAMLNYEREKNDFFTSISSEILFEYIYGSDMLILSDYTVNKFGLSKHIMNSRGNADILSFVGEENAVKIVKAIKSCSPENPQKNVLMSKNGKDFEFIVHTVWTKEDKPAFNGCYGKIVDLSRAR